MIQIKKIFLTLKVIAILSLVSLTSCSNKENNQLLGAAAGAALGGLVGVQFGAGTGQLLMTAIGSGIGAYLGNEIANRLTESEKISLDKSINNTAKFGDIDKTYSWENKSKDIKALIKPLSEIKAEKGSCKKMKILMIHGDENYVSNEEVCYKNS